jgi:hypothetical protein
MDEGMQIKTERLAVPGGWLYKVTEWGVKRNSFQICFAPKGKSN